jgi:HSF-type DNA-binding
MCVSVSTTPTAAAANNNRILESMLADRALYAKASPTIQHKRKHDHIIVVHDYHDHANDPVSESMMIDEVTARGGVTTPFPIKLHEMLQRVSEEGLDHIVSWQPHGRCFVVHKPKDFPSLLMKYFKLSKIASFQRQLNLYGFQRLTRGADKNGYYHELFLRNRVFLANQIQRVKVKGTGVRARSNPDQEPDLWGMPWVGHMDTPVQSGGVSVVSLEAPASSFTPSALPLPPSLPSPSPSLTSTSTSPAPVQPSCKSFSLPVAQHSLASAINVSFTNYNAMNSSNDYFSSNDDKDDEIIHTGWGKSFYYLDPLTSSLDVQAPSSSSAATTMYSTPASLPILSEPVIDFVLDDKDLDELAHEIADHDYDTLADILDRIIE